MLYKKIMTIEQMQDEKAWLEMRMKGIGGSEASAVCGLNRYKSPHALWLEKTNKIEHEDLSDNQYIYWGHKLEPVIADWFTETTGKKVQRAGLMQSIANPFMLASVDRLVVGENAGLEIKTASGYKSKEWQLDEVPDEYYIQCQHYMAVTGCDKWYIAVLIGGNNCIWKEIPRNDDDIKELIAIEKDFWYMVMNNIEPPIDGSQASTEALNKKFIGGQKEPVELPSTAEDKAKKLLELQEQERNIKIDISLLQNEIKEEMGDNEEAYRGNYQFSWNTVKGRTSIDSKKLKQEKPDIYMAYLKTGSPSRRFSCKYVD